VQVVHVLEEPGPDAREGVDFHAKGRINLALLKSVLPFDEFDFYLCGPPPFMQALYAGLRSLNVPDGHIHAESFGPAGLRRDSTPAAAPVSTEAVPVFFAASAKEARWTPDSGSLLELAESRGLNPAYSCRQGMCGSCSHVLKSGSVTYATPPASVVEPGHVLLCQAVPAAGSAPLVVEA
jgi:ferredoxin